MYKALVKSRVRRNVKLFLKKKSKKKKLGNTNAKFCSSETLNVLTQLDFTVEVVLYIQKVNS